MRFALLCAALAAVTACGPAATPEQLNAIEDKDPQALASMKPLTRKDLPAATARVSVGRMYQHGNWTIPAADTYKPELFATRNEQRIAYVCDNLTVLQPTWVSGLMRVDADDVLTDDMVAVYNGVKTCLRTNVGPVRFDVVLNALHYTDEAKSKEDAVKKFRARFDDIRKRLHPDLYFFDFYSLPWNEKHKRHREWHPDAMKEIITVIHGHDRLVGGNVWSFKIPDGSDFVALDNFDREDGKVPGMQVVRDQCEAFKSSGLPILMHIENNPQKHPSNGLDFIKDTAEGRKETVSQHVAAQKVGYAYMFPTFFPLRQVEVQKNAACVPTEDDPCETREKMESFDAAKDDLLWFMSVRMGDKQ